MSQPTTKASNKYHSLLYAVSEDNNFDVSFTFTKPTRRFNWAEAASETEEEVETTPVEVVAEKVEEVEVEAPVVEAPVKPAKAANKPASDKKKALSKKELQKLKKQKEQEEFDKLLNSVATDDIYMYYICASL
ncbi:hypothetical protein WA158_000254 [Blastocystis sp. Blastoise]